MRLKHKVVPQFVGKLKTPKNRVYDGYYMVISILLMGIMITYNYTLYMHLFAVELSTVTMVYRC